MMPKNVRNLALASFLTTGLMAWSGCNTENPDGTPNALGKAEEKIKEGEKKVVEEAKIVGKEIKEDAKIAGEKIKEGAEKAGEKIKEGAEAVKEKVGDMTKPSTPPAPVTPPADVPK
jgi:hypothetical protein